MKRAAILLALLGCAEDPPCADRRDLLQSEAGLVMTRTEHPEGWGQTACAQCHPAWTYHDEDCIEGVVLDLPALDAADPAGCAACHGANGVAAWQELTP